ncbi:hypothetical protein B5F07_07165 [Lachnoclostridium sp. An169]|uniref:hypothetical protein n=1 Tax=Lachnoclostridium sp. An169 TaxID=1965569 RepID=UPI000B3A9D49|nr:hypothetical protein [Lachnoclostridium sp. An169]OUP84605.1 hypothetical protein B5F07_07165 [Lachnoclostridium sp. An169]
MLKYRGQKEKLRQYMQENKAYFGQVDVETYQALRVFLHSEKMLKDMKKTEREERNDMCQALEDIYTDGVKAGKLEGEAAGRLEGERREKQLIITKMLRDGLPVSAIRKYTDATDEELKIAGTALAAAQEKE